ncbi:MAG: D-alanyl-D-alanine carboxypeptidase, partial [Methylobacteriaceae bacterium]|nr:D-alanyl-D-alanine carboxypeptidase [Methylobacteriaceae bacterium]
MRSLLSVASGLAVSAALVSSSRAEPVLVMDAASGAVLYEQEATQPWYPASLTKLMTVYVALKAVHEGRLTLDTPLVVSDYANSMSPSKMGFRPGTEVTLDNALKMLMV